jgi:hypothetical protein
MFGFENAADAAKASALIKEMCKIREHYIAFSVRSGRSATKPT